VVLALVLLAVLWLWYAGRLDTTVSDGASAPPLPDSTTGPSVQADQILVDLRDDATPEQIQSLERNYGLKLRPNSRFSFTARLYRAVTRLRDRSTLIQRLRREPVVENAELDVLYGIPPLENALTRFTPDEGGQKKFPNDPKYRFQWHLDQIGMPDAWPRGTGRGVTVAVIDTGVAYRDRGAFKQVPDLAQTEIVEGYDFVHKNAYPVDDHGHGTHVAGTIAQSTHNGIGVAGVAYRARIMPLKVLSAQGFGSVADIAEAVRFAADHGAKVINMSLGGGRASRILASAVKYAHDHGVTVVCAAGNDGRGQVSYPAAYPGAIAVAATQFDRTTTFYSNWGKEIDLAAPGGNTRVDQNGDGMPDGVLQNTLVPGHPDQNDYLLFMGTSMASPHVAGVAALVVESGVTNPDAVERLLESTAHHPQGKSRDDHYGAGIVDAGAALRKTRTTWGGYRLGLSTLLGLLLLLGLHEKRRLALRPGAAMAFGLLLGSAGLFFFPAPAFLASSSEAATTAFSLLTQGFPAWDGALLGASAHATPFFHSALLPLLSVLVLWSVVRARGLLFGFAVGVGGHLLFSVPFFTADVAWIPNVLCLDQVWLGLNGLFCLGLGHLLARK
jgi:serine protease